MKTCAKWSLRLINSLNLAGMKSFMLLLLLLPVQKTTSLAQTNDGPIDPLLGGYAAGVSDEIVFLWADFTNTGGGYDHAKVYDYISFGNPEINNQLISKSRDSIYAQLPSKQSLDAFSEDLDGDGFDEIIESWAGNNDQPLQILVRKIDSTDFSFMEVADIGVLNEDETLGSPTLVRMVSGNFDNDLGKEFILAFLSEDSVRIILYDTDGGIIPIRKTSIQDEAIYLNNSALNYDITTGDLDGDGTDEIVLMGGERTQVYDDQQDQLVNRESMFVKLYDVIIDRDYEIQPKGRAAGIAIVNDMMEGESIKYKLNGLRVTSVDFDNNGIDEIVTGYQVYDNRTYFLLQALAAYPTLDSLQLHDDPIVIHQDVLDERGASMSITAGDMKADGDEQVVFAAWNKLAVYDADDELTLTPIAEYTGINVAGSFSGDSYHRTIAVTDLDAGTAQDIWRKEIVLFDKQEVGEFSETGIQFRVFEAKVDYNGELKLKQRAYLTDNSFDMTSDAPVAVITGNFDDDGMRLGTPRRYKETGVFQPLVVLNAPPVHFDMLDNVPYDISGCFDGGDCDFIATYEEGLSQTEEITSQLNSDWGISAKLYFNYEVAGNKLDTYLKGNYGKSFSHVEKSSHTITVGVKVQAIHDDLIYATVSDYTVWEYPVYDHGTFQGYMTAIVPELTENRWFPSKSWSGNAYLSNHEAGNIMSYPDFDQFPEITADNEMIKGVVNNNYSLGPNTSYEWRLEFSDFQENSVSETSKTGVEVGVDAAYGDAGSLEVSAEPLGVGGSVSSDYKIQVGLEVVGNYNREKFSSHTTTVKKDLLLKVALGGTTNSETGYQITPYAYWSESGAMVIDYAVDVDQAPQGYTTTWWQLNYGTRPDPAFILPWRLDPEKGYDLISDLKREQTKDIVISPRGAQPGDTILVFARIHNFSLLPTPHPVRVSFYLGDPDTDGVPVQSNDGETVWQTSDVIASRSYEWIHFGWVMPKGGRLFAVLDPDNDMDEIHEDNNKGWIALGHVDDEGVYTGTGPSRIDENSIYAENSGLRNYPNPFSDITIISYLLDKEQSARIRITDLSGRDILVRDEGYQSPGEHSFEFDGSSLSGGVYILILELDSGEVSNSMMVVE